MESITHDRIALFADNAQAIKKGFTWHNTMTRRLAAFLYAQVDKPVDGEYIRQCYMLMKQNTGLFSMFRGNMAICVAAMLSLSEDPQKQFDETLKVYEMLKVEKLRASDYLAVAAYIIAEQVKPGYQQDAVTRTRAFYDIMKKRHYFTTGQDDYIYAAMLGLSELEAASGMKRVGQFYDRLKNEFWDKNSVQALSHVLVLGGSDDSSAARVVELRNAFRARRIRLDKSFTLPALGILALLPVETETIVQSIYQMQKSLREQRGFSKWSVSAQELLLYAVALVTDEYLDSEDKGIVSATISTGVTGIIIAMEVALIVTIAAASAAAASS